MGNSLHRRQLLLAVGAGAVGAAAGVGNAPAVFAQAQGEGDTVEGSWHINVEVIQPGPATFDALYGFGDGGVFVRIDGRNNAPAVGTWKRTEDGAIVFSNILFNFANGVRTGFITGKFIARVADGAMTGSFTAEGHDVPGFVTRVGTFTGTRIVPEAP